MTHLHNITDHDKHFVIDPMTKKIQPERPEKNTLVRYSHNSELFTFELDRMIEGHDMSLCNIVEVHYINISSNKQNKNSDIYEVKDLGLLENNTDKIAFTWPIKKNATMLDGVLTFAIRFACSDGNEIVYEWPTEIFSSISISNTIHNNEIIVEEYSDILNQWKEDLFSIDGVIQTAKKESLEAINAAKAETVKSLMDEGTKQVNDITAISDGIAKDTTAKQILEKENKATEFLEVIAQAAGKAGSLNGFGLEKGLKDSVVISYTNPDTNILEGTTILPRDTTLLKIKDSLVSINKSLKIIAIRNGVTI